MLFAYLAFSSSCCCAAISQLQYPQLTTLLRQLLSNAASHIQALQPLQWKAAIRLYEASLRIDPAELGVTRAGYARLMQQRASARGELQGEAKGKRHRRTWRSR